MLSSHPPIELTRTHRLRVDKTFRNVYFGGKDEIFIGENIVGSAYSHSTIHLLKTGNIVNEILIRDAYSNLMINLKQNGGFLDRGQHFSLDADPWWPYRIENDGEDWGIVSIDNILLKDDEDNNDLKCSYHRISNVVSKILAKEEKLRDDINSAVQLFHTEAEKVLLSK